VKLSRPGIIFSIIDFFQEVTGLDGLPHP